MNDSFGDMIAEGWLVVYMDDILITSPDHDKDEERTKRVLQRLKDLDLHLKLKKCKFDVSEVDYLGLILRPGSIAMDPKKLAGIADWPTPSSVKEVQSFLGFTNYYRRFIYNYSTIARPLINLTRKTSQWRWSSTCQETFDLLKKLFLQEPVLVLPDLSKPFAIATDASLVASGGILLGEVNEWSSDGGIVVNETAVIVSET